MLIADSQVHLWPAETPDRPWVPGMEPQLPDPLTIEVLQGHMASAGVNRVVIVPPQWDGMRTDYAMQAYDRFPEQFRYMGRPNINKPELPAQLPDYMKPRGILGMRLSFLAPNERANLLKGTYDWLWPAAERYGIRLMINTGDTMPAFAPIAERHPGLTMIFDHMGLSLQIAKENRCALAIANTVALARFPNVYSKVSSVPTHSHEAYPFRDMHEHVHRVIDAFGPNRCFWGSDLSLMLHKCSYRQGVTLFTEELKLSPDALELVMGKALCDTLKWPLPA